jgi:hypothetical protein
MLLLKSFTESFELTPVSIVYKTTFAKEMENGAIIPQYN